MSYRAQVVRLYLELPDTPCVASDNDWAVAADFHRRNVPLEIIAHALRLGTLRRHSSDRVTLPETIRCLAYYRRVIDNLSPDELDPDYVAHVEKRFRLLVHTAAARQTAVR